MLSRLFNCAPVLFTVGGSGAQFQRVNVLGVILDLLLPSIHDAITVRHFTTLGSFKNMCLNSNLGLDDLCAKALAERSRALLPMFSVSKLRIRKRLTDLKIHLRTKFPHTGDAADHDFPEAVTRHLTMFKDETMEFLKILTLMMEADADLQTEYQAFSRRLDRDPAAVHMSEHGRLLLVQERERKVFQEQQMREAFTHFSPHLVSAAVSVSVPVPVPASTPMTCDEMLQSAAESDGNGNGTSNGWVPSPCASDVSLCGSMFSL
ncbi:MAG: hypothetical protein WDW38_006427 [Sanguina aurantia]